MRSSISKISPATSSLWLLAGFLVFVALLPPQASAANPCCAIKSIDARTGLVTAVERATGRRFAFSVRDHALLKSLRAGQAVFANFSNGQISFDGTNVAGKIASGGSFAGGSNAKPQGAPMAGAGAPPASSNVAMAGAGAANSQARGSFKGDANPGQPCCEITAINSSSGTVTAKEISSGRSFQFSVPDSGLLSSLRVGQGVYANYPQGKVSVDGFAPCCSIIGAGAAATPIATDGTAAAGAVNNQARGSFKGNANPAEPCCQITAINAQTGMVTARVNATGQTFQFQTSPQLLQSLKVGQRVYANFTAKRASLDGKSACCVIVDLPGLIGPAEGSTLPSGSSLGSSITTPVNRGGTSQSCTATCPAPVAVPCPVGAVGCTFSASSAVCETACTTMAKCNAGYTLVRTTSCNVFNTKATCQLSCPAVSTGQPFECASGYYGAMCAACPGGASNKCSGHGSCNDGITGTGQCTCNPGFNGPSCQFSDAVTCSGHGTADYSGQCTCSAGYSGNSCDVKN